jgi:hypothetical protein
MEAVNIVIVPLALMFPLAVMCEDVFKSPVISNVAAGLSCPPIPIFCSLPFENKVVPADVPNFISTLFSASLKCIVSPAAALYFCPDESNSILTSVSDASSIAPLLKFNLLLPTLPTESVFVIISPLELMFPLAVMCPVTSSPSVASNSPSETETALLLNLILAD